MITLSFGNVQPTSTIVGTIATINKVGANPPGRGPQSFWVQAVSFQALGTNLGTVFICDTPTPDLALGIGILWELPIPDGATGKSRPAWVIGDPSRPNNPVNVAQFFILPSNTGEGVRVSAIRSGTSQSGV